MYQNAGCAREGGRDMRKRDRENASCINSVSWFGIMDMK